MNPLFWFIAILVSIAAFLFTNPGFLHKMSNRHETGFMSNRHARHPDGLESTIEWDAPNENGKHMWKFNEWPFPIHAEIGLDIIVEPGAEEGKGFYVFRVNRNGSSSPSWEDNLAEGRGNPYYAKYFLEQRKKHEALQQLALEASEEADLKELGALSPTRKISDGLDEEFIQAGYSHEKWLAERNRKKKKAAEPVKKTEEEAYREG